MITDMKNAKIFSPLQLGRTTLKNRIAMAPMSMHYEATNGTVPKQLADIFVRRAEGGAGYVVIDAVTVDHKYWYIGKTTALDKDSLVQARERCRQHAHPADHSPGSGVHLCAQGHHAPRPVREHERQRRCQPSDHHR